MRKGRPGGAALFFGGDIVADRASDKYPRKHFHVPASFTATC